MERVFESENILFVEVSELLIRDYLLMVNDIEHVDRFLGGWHEPYTEEQEIAWVRKKREEKAPVFSMLEKKSGRFIGNIELMDPTDLEGELGIAVTAEKQNMGYGTEAVSAMTQYGLEQLGLRRIFLRTDPANARAIRVYEKCGFREYERTEEHVCMEFLQQPGADGCSTCAASPGAEAEMENRTIGDRIIVLGCPGSGKSTLAESLHRRTGLPLHHLDGIWWRADRTHISREDFDRRLQAILQGEKWIIDGDFSRTYEPRFLACDTVIFLDYSEEDCMRGITERLGNARPDVPWVDERLDPELVKQVVSYQTENRPKLYELIGKYPDKRVLIFETRAQAQTWLSGI